MAGNNNGRLTNAIGESLSPAAIKLTVPFRVIRDAGQSPHWAYAAGMSRLSCVFCIMASRADLYTAAQLQPALYRQYANLEERIGHTLSPSGIPLTRLTGVPL